MSQDHTSKRVIVAMSGGVDSSVAATLLTDQGYEVIGIMLRLWAEEIPEKDTFNRCCSPIQMDDARCVADKLHIPFYVLDAREKFRQTIVNYFIQQHQQALTPNPCLECNRLIRFQFLLDHALALNADYLATGHYARINLKANGEYTLQRAADLKKDQSYVLSILNQEQLKHLLFPIGNYSKTTVREIARQRGLPVAEKPDSQDLCFLRDGNYRRFLAEHTPEILLPGPIILQKDGTVIGEHNGLANYTIGQRKGLPISYREPLYVLAMNPSNNTLTVGFKEETKQDSLTASQVNWISGHPPTQSFHAEVKIRYKSSPATAIIKPLSETRINIQFDNSQFGITPGQATVLYNNDLCLGGGIIERPEINPS